MATPPRPINQDLNELLQFQHQWHVDPAPWWWLQQLDKGALNKLAQISMQRQKEVLTAQAKALDAVMKVAGGG